MTSEQLIAEGRELQRPSMFLRPQGRGPVAAVWHERDEGQIERTGHHCWITVDSRHVCGLSTSVSGYLRIFTDEEKCEGGRVEVVPSWPDCAGTKLYAHPASVLPPIDAVFARGSDAVGDWIRSHGWERTERYNDNFNDADIVREYERVWLDEFPLYNESDVYAVLGGWHWPCADDDWHHLIDETLMVLTVRDSEPWVEAWRTRAGRFKVIQRIT
ncbi:MAG: hypothetical protein DWQ45_22630 [Planctomycetota bacterium]|nr:MAG: hypothetical protein DWQ41_22595 [Planctomycetota bacterium]REK29609.1 MAG: hypothetical protein DWQ45_22630 [Planctomycetota bacterium]